MLDRETVDRTEAVSDSFDLLPTGRAGLGGMRAGLLTSRDVIGVAVPLRETVERTEATSDERGRVGGVGTAGGVRKGALRSTPLARRVMVVREAVERTEAASEVVVCGRMDELEGTGGFLTGVVVFGSLEVRTMTRETLVVVDARVDRLATDARLAVVILLETLAVSESLSLPDCPARPLRSVVDLSGALSEVRGLAIELDKTRGFRKGLLTSLTGGAKSSLMG